MKSGASFVSTQIANSSDQNWNFKIKAVLYEGEDIYDDYFKYGILDPGATFMTVPNKVMNALIGKIRGVYGEGAFVCSNTTNISIQCYFPSIPSS